MPEGLPEGTVTVLFTDIVGSTGLKTSRGDAAAQEIMRAHDELVWQQIELHSGQEVKTMGDGFMAAFDSARKAVDCAIAIQRALADWNNAVGAPLGEWAGAGGAAPGAGAGAGAPGQPVRVRIGLHMGEAIKEGEDFFGKHVNLAARIAGLAAGGEILVSSLLKELPESAGEFAFGEARKVELKGLRGKHSVFQVAWE